MLAKILISFFLAILGFFISRMSIHDYAYNMHKILGKEMPCAKQSVFEWIIAKHYFHSVPKLLIVIHLAILISIPIAPIVIIYLYTGIYNHLTGTFCLGYGVFASSAGGLNEMICRGLVFLKTGRDIDDTDFSDTELEPLVYVPEENDNSRKE